MQVGGYPSGTRVDRYELSSLLGSGGMAVVYRARHVDLGSDVALKILTDPGEQVRQRLLAEGRVQAQVRHPNLVAVRDIVEHDGFPALVLEFVDGVPLDGWLTCVRPSQKEALGVFRGILAGVMAAHRAGLVHRDLKPANVLLHTAAEGVIPKVADFGLVKILEGDAEDDGRLRTRAGMAMGTSQYMAPEQIRDASTVDQRADLFALGCILYELVTGHRAFDAGDRLANLNAICRGQYRPATDYRPGLSPVVDDVIAGLLTVDRDLRIQTAGEVWTRLYGDADPNEIPAVKLRDSSQEYLSLDSLIDEEQRERLRTHSSIHPQRNLRVDAPTELELEGPAASPRLLWVTIGIVIVAASLCAAGAIVILLAG